VFGKGYPADMIQDYAARGLLTSPPDFVAAGDLETIAAPIDFLGLNYYSSVAVTAANESVDSGVLPNRHPPPGFTEMGWRITPPGLTELLQRLRDDYAPGEIVITENGASYSDGPGADGAVHDDRRIAYLRDHIAAVGAAIADGVPVTGYFVWSFMDNFEWSLGYSQRFGLVWIDFETLQRLPKDSFHWYRDVIARN
jgi:beta-glucosidase